MTEDYERKTRRELKEMNARAREVVIEMGVTLHPRVLALKFGDSTIGGTLDFDDRDESQKQMDAKAKEVISMLGLFSQLTSEQQKEALKPYVGEENHGDPAYRLNPPV